MSLYITHAHTFDKSSRISHKVQENFLNICGTKIWYKYPRFSSNPVQRLYKSVKRIFLLQSIAIYGHPRHTATNCGKCTVVPYRGFTVIFWLHNLRVKNPRTWKVPVVENLPKGVKEHEYCSVINQQGTAVNEHEMGPLYVLYISLIARECFTEEILLINTENGICTTETCASGTL